MARRDLLLSVHNKSPSRHVLGNLYHEFIVHSCARVVVAFIGQLALVTSGLC